MLADLDRCNAHDETSLVRNAADYATRSGSGHNTVAAGQGLGNFRTFGTTPIIFSVLIDMQELGYAVIQRGGKSLCPKTGPLPAEP